MSYTLIRGALAVYFEEECSCARVVLCKLKEEEEPILCLKLEINNGGTLYDFQSLIKIAEEYLLMVERGRNYARENVHPFYLVSCLALIDRGSLMLRQVASVCRDRFRTAVQQSYEAANKSTIQYRLMKLVAFSDCAGDYETASIWASVAHPTETPRRFIPYEYSDPRDRFVDQIRRCSIFQKKTHFDEEVREAERVVWQLHNRYAALIAHPHTEIYKFRFGKGGLNVQRNAMSSAVSRAELILQCLLERRQTQDKAVHALLDAARAVAAKDLQQRLAAAQEGVADPSRDQIAAATELLRRAHTISSFREDSVIRMKALEALQVEKRGCTELQLSALYAALMDESERELHERQVYMAQLEVGNVSVQGEQGEHERLKHALTQRLTWAKQTLAKLMPVRRRLVALSKSPRVCQEDTCNGGGGGDRGDGGSDSGSGRAPSLVDLERRCWDMAQGYLESTMNSLTTIHDRGDEIRFTCCAQAELCARVVESILAEAVQYERECRCEWRPEVKQLLGQAAHWARTAAAWTLDRIEETNLSVDVASGWEQCYHDEADLCAFMYSCAADELRHYMNKAKCTDEQSLLCAQLLQTVSMTSACEANLRAQMMNSQDVTSPERTKHGAAVLATASELREWTGGLIENHFPDHSEVLIRHFNYWAQRALTAATDPATIETAVVYREIAQKAHSLLTAWPGASLREEFALVQHLSYFIVWREESDRGGVRETNLRLIVDQFECLPVYLRQRSSSYGAFRYTIVAGAAVGLALASDLGITIDEGASLLLSPEEQQQQLKQQQALSEVRELPMVRYIVTRVKELARLQEDNCNQQNVQNALKGIEEAYTKLGQQFLK